MYTIPNLSEKFNFRYVKVKGVTYLRAEDVAEWVGFLGSSEETDVRNRLKQASRQLLINNISVDK